MPEQLSSSVLEALGFALFEREAPGLLRLANPAPEWLRRLWPATTDPQTLIAVAELSPFLDNFMVDAETAWDNGAASRSQSGPWIELDSEGTELTLEATVLTLQERRILLLERLGDAFSAKKQILQKARETVIAYQRLNSEMQKKEILLHCVAEDMSAASGNIMTALWLIETEHDLQKIRDYLNLASLATQEQRNLINNVVSLFADDMNGLYGRTATARAEGDLALGAASAVEAARDRFADKRVRLDLMSGCQQAAVHADSAHLERVVTNLLDNALQHTLPGQRVIVTLGAEPGAVLLQVEDTGSSLPASVTEKLFSKFDASASRGHASALRLHFCKIAVENCNGEIGYTPREGGGNVFWIRLPRLPA